MLNKSAYISLSSCWAVGAEKEISEAEQDIITPTQMATITMNKYFF